MSPKVPKLTVEPFQVEGTIEKLQNRKEQRCEETKDSPPPPPTKRKREIRESPISTLVSIQFGIRRLGTRPRCLRLSPLPRQEIELFRRTTRHRAMNLPGHRAVTSRRVSETIHPDEASALST